MRETDMSTSPWRKSSFSEAGNCVEVAAGLDGQVLVRDTKLSAGSNILSFSLPKWREFIVATNQALS